MNEIPNMELIAKYLSGECSKREIDEIKNWISLNEENAKLFESIKKVWDTPEKEFVDSDVDALWEELSIKAGINPKEESSKIYKIDSKPESKNWWQSLDSTTVKFLRYAAGFAIGILLPAILYIWFSTSDLDNMDNWEKVLVENGEQSTLTLSDGTLVTLDAGSELYFPAEFKSDSRRVKLNGAGYFEVTHNEEQPFNVLAKNGRVEVLGTKFHVIAWEKVNNVEVVVSEGKVSLNDEEDGTNSILLEKGYAGKLFSDGSITESIPINVDKALSWLRGERYFTDAQLSEVLNQVEHWFDVEILLADSTILNEKVSVFIQKKSLVNTLELLAGLTNSIYELNNNTVKISPQINK